MKTIEEAANDYSCRKDNETDAYCGFKAGATFAQRWIPVEEELPEENESVLCKNELGYFVAELAKKPNSFRVYSARATYRATHWRPIEFK